MNDKSVLVTGASGMIGTVLVDRLLAEGYDVTGVDKVSNEWEGSVDGATITADLCESDELARLPTDVDIVVHLAANARVHRLVKNPKRARDNFEMTFNVLEYVRDNDVPRVLFGSSREVYGNR